MANGRGREEASAGARRVTKNKNLSFTRCSRRSFLCVGGKLGNEGHGVMLLLTLRRLWRYSFVYLSSKFWTSYFNVCRCALFVLAVFYAN